MKRFALKRLVTGICATGMIGFSSYAMASAFQLWEQSGASIGNYHAGYAASVDDASTSFFNPAGMTLFKNQQVVFGGVLIPTSFKYKGTVRVNTIEAGAPFTVTAQGGTFNFIPDLHYVAPINDWLAFGLSAAAPFGLKTDYGRDTFIRYNATLSSLWVADLSPALAAKVYKGLSIGAGFDVQLARGEFNLVAGSGFGRDTDSINKANDTAYGYHLGALYEFTPEARIGASFHSQVVHHLTGTSNFVGPIAELLNVNSGRLPVNNFSSDRAKVNLTLPPYLALSGYYHFEPKIAVMGTVVYTKWNVFQTLVLQDVAGAAPALVAPGLVVPTRSTSIIVSVPEKYKNTWNASFGVDYFPTETIKLRSGVGYDQSPVTNPYRNVQLPDNDRYIIALGGHYQASKALSFDVGWSHFIFSRVPVNPPTLVVGVQEVKVNGNVRGGADAYGGQITWDIV